MSVMPVAVAIAWLAITAAASVSEAAEPSIVISDGNSLLRVCQEAVDGVNNPREKLGESDAVRRGAYTIACANFLQGVTQTNILFHPGPTAAPTPCLPENGVSNSQAARIVVRFLQANPEQLHQAAVINAILALDSAFPCPKTKGRR